MNEDKLIGLAVVTYKDNFGSALQTYATQTVIRNLGFDTKIFDISLVSNTINHRKINYFLKRILNKDEASYFFDFVLDYIRRLRPKKNTSYSNKMLIRHKMYEEFNNFYLDFFEPASE